MLAKLFPMTKSNINSFLERSKLNNDIEQASQVCIDRINQIQSQYNVKVNNNNEWVYKTRTKNIETPTEAANIEKPVSITELKDFITNNSCPNCNNHQPLNDCSFKTETNCNIIEAIQQLVIYLNKVQSTTYTNCVLG